MKTASLFAIAVATVTVAAGVAGCADSIHEGWLVDRTRVLGVRVEAAGAPERASLAAGEAGHLFWLLAAPNEMPRVAWAFAVCLPPEGNFAEPRCETPVLVSGSGTTTGEVIDMQLEVPPAAVLGGAKELLVLAAFCSQGSPTLEAATFTATCGPDEPLLASAMVRLAAGGFNANPGTPSVSLSDAPLPEDDQAPPGAPCTAAPNAPKQRAGGPQVDLVYAFDGSERDSGESILLSTIVTDGTLEREYSAFDPEEAPPKTVHVVWTPPNRETVSAAGQIVRFYVVLRDGRAGASFGRFAVCVRAD